MEKARFIDGSTQVRLFEEHFEAFLAVLRGALTASVVNPERVINEFPLRDAPHGETHLKFMYMPGTYGDTIGLKFLAFPLPRTQRPSMAQGISVVFRADCTIGALLDARTLTSLRTACVTGLGARELASNNVARVGIVGFGLQGRAHLAVLSHIYPRAEFRVHDLRREVVEEYARKRGDEIRLRAAREPLDAAREADVLVTTTTSKAPIVHEDWVRPGMLYCQIGRDNECADEAIMRFDKLVVDDWGEMLREGYKSLARLHVTGQLPKGRTVDELPRILAGKAEGRTRPEESIMLCCTGLSVEDIALAGFVAAKATETGLGVPLDLSHTAF